MPSSTTVLDVVQLIQLVKFLLSMVVGLHVLVYYYVEQEDKTSHHPRMSVKLFGIILVYSQAMESLF